MSQRFDTIQKTLFTLAAAASVTACASAKPAQDPVKASETTSAQTAGTASQAGCGAHADGQSGCGASKGTGQASCGAGKTDGTAAAPAAATGTEMASAPGDKPADKPAAAKPKKKAGGAASCGAGTCGKK